MDSSVSRYGRHGLSHLRRVRHLHHFRCGLSLLRREEPLRADSRRSARDAHLLHHLSAVQQPDDPLCGETSRTRQTGRVPALLATHDCSWGTLFVRHWPGMAPLDLRARPHYFHEPFWNNVLFAGWPACLSRECWIDHAEHRAPFRACCRVGPEQSARVDVLSLYWHFVDAV